MTSKKTKSKTESKSLEAKVKSQQSTPKHISEGRIEFVTHDSEGHPVIINYKIPDYNRGNRTLSHYSSDCDDCVEGFYRED